MPRAVSYVKHKKLFVESVVPKGGSTIQFEYNFWWKSSNLFLKYDVIKGFGAKDVLYWKV